MKTHKFEVTNKELLIWLLICIFFGTVFAHFSVVDNVIKASFNWDIWLDFFMFAMMPTLFITLFGKLIKNNMEE